MERVPYIVCNNAFSDYKAELDWDEIYNLHIYDIDFINYLANRIDNQLPN
jgi:hypothetical protein